ncbi:alpha/beta fold hydrolase [Spongisporangium articulatum]|uniref:Alpha/beta fold hydrolase n=1 Tax=Spongisporangium articulatum TaxID=3362603 RepID=A0ABW8AHT1_9ACTN
MAVTVRTPGLYVVEHEVEVPLDHADPGGATITVFAREVSDPDRRDRPYLLFLQGGPGFEAARPTGDPLGPGWLGRALQDYRVLLLDQRGTGRSTPVGPELASSGLTPQQQADYLSHFRADSIVRDAELVREALGVTRWSVLGQSFGGFCTLHYLSTAPDSLREAFFTGGVPPVGMPVDDIYSATFAKQRERNERYYARYPGDRDRVRRIHAALDAEPLLLPTGDRLTSRRFRSAGHGFGMSDGPDQLHYLLELPITSPAFRHDVQAGMGFARNPLYALVHEASYADGGVTGWASERVMPSDYADDVTLFFGEHLFPWAFTDYGALAPLRETADLLAGREWPRLYDEDVLRSNEIPCAAAVYADDPYVLAEHSMATAGLVRGLRPWLTNEYLHNAIRADGARVLDRLIDLARGRA